MPKERATLELTAPAVQAAYWLLTDKETKGRAEGRRIRQSIKGLKKGAMKQGDSAFAWGFLGGEVDLKVDHWIELRKTGTKYYDTHGVPGQYAEGLDELMEPIEDLELDLRAKEKAAQESEDACEDECAGDDGGTE